MIIFFKYFVLSLEMYAYVHVAAVVLSASVRVTVAAALAVFSLLLLWANNAVGSTRRRVGVRRKN